MTNHAEQKAKIGLCLGGGGALGYAHIGVLKALEENGIYPEVISGSSMGAIVGVLYAGGLTPDELIYIIHHEKMYKLTTLINPTFSRRGLSSLKVLQVLLQNLLPANEISSLEREFYVCVSNLTKARWEMVGEGAIDKYVVASASIPYIFEAVSINGMLYADGGLLNNLPAQALQGRCDVIIGVDVLPHFEVHQPLHAMDTLMMPIRALVHSNSAAGRAVCDFLIEPAELKSYNSFSFEKYAEIYKIGYAAASEYIGRHPEMVVSA